MSEYKRYTEKRNGINVIPLRNAVCGFDMPKWSIAQESDIQSFLSGDAVERLAELEDKIEQGTLIEAPKPKYVVAESNITGEKFVCKLLPQALYSEGKNAWTFRYDTFAFSTILYKFDTKEEAEKRLKELQE